jgi:HrpA-like RNA helicase
VKGPAPIVQVSGRTYPIEIRYRPVDELKERREAARLLGEEARPKTERAISTTKTRSTRP